MLRVGSELQWSWWYVYCGAGCGGAWGVAAQWAQYPNRCAQTMTQAKGKQAIFASPLLRLLLAFLFISWNLWFVPQPLCVLLFLFLIGMLCIYCVVVFAVSVPCCVPSGMHVVCTTTVLCIMCCAASHVLIAVFSITIRHRCVSW